MEDMVTLAEAAAHLRRNPELVRQWIKSGRLAARKRAGRWFLSGDALARFQRNQPVRRTRRSRRAS